MISVPCLFFFHTTKTYTTKLHTNAYLCVYPPTFRVGRVQFGIFLFFSLTDNKNHVLWWKKCLKSPHYQICFTLTPVQRLSWQVKMIFFPYSYLGISITMDSTTRSTLHRQHLHRIGWMQYAVRKKKEIFSPHHSLKRVSLFINKYRESVLSCVMQKKNSLFIS